MYRPILFRILSRESSRPVYDRLLISKEPRYERDYFRSSSRVFLFFFSTSFSLLFFRVERESILRENEQKRPKKGRRPRYRRKQDIVIAGSNTERNCFGPLARSAHEWLLCNLVLLTTVAPILSTRHQRNTKRIRDPHSLFFSRIRTAHFGTTTGRHLVRESLFTTLHSLKLIDTEHIRDHAVRKLIYKLRRTIETSRTYRFIEYGKYNGKWSNDCNFFSSIFHFSFGRVNSFPCSAIKVHRYRSVEYNFERGTSYRVLGNIFYCYKCSNEALLNSD